MKQQLSPVLEVAWRHFEDASTSETERDAILVAIIKASKGDAGETASRILQARREAQTHQMTLKGILGRR